MRLVFLHTILLDGIRACFCWDIENRIIKFISWSMSDDLWLFYLCVFLCCFSMFLYLVIGKFFSINLDVLDVVKVINGIV